MALNKAKAIKKFEQGILTLAEAEPHAKVLLYGKSGKGKTRIAATAPDVLILDINERGTQSVRSFPGHVRPIDRWEDLTFAYWYLKEGNHDFKSVVLDTITMAQGMCMSHILREAEDRDPNREPNMPDRRTWGKLGELMRPLLLNFRNLPMHVVFVAQERLVDDPDDTGDETAQIHVPDLSPNPRACAMACVGVMGRVYQKKERVVVTDSKGRKKEGSRWVTKMLVGPHEEFETKDRTGRLGRIVTNPTIPQIIAAVAEWQEEEA